MTKDVALKLALEALEYANTGNRRPEIIGPAITAIKEALAQPEQEPVAIYQFQKSDGSWIDQDKGSYRYNSQHGHAVRIVYTTPPKAQPLTDEQIDKAMAENKQTLIDAADNYWKMRRAYARIIEAAHGIKE